MLWCYAVSRLRQAVSWGEVQVSGDDVAGYVDDRSLVPEGIGPQARERVVNRNGQAYKGLATLTGQYWSVIDRRTEGSGRG